MMNVYMDNAATTRIKEEVVTAMMPYFTADYGNPSSLHSFGRKARLAVDTARNAVAKALNANDNEIYFTSGGTESDNLAIKGVLEANGRKGHHIITTAIEHHAVLNTFEYLEKKGYEVTYVMPDGDGIVSPKRIEDALRDDTFLLSVMFANNEIGTLQPIAEIGALARSRGVVFHTDAVQAAGSVPIDVQAQNIDMLSLSAHKFHGPKGTGVLYVRKNIKFLSQSHGGSHEFGKRPGTENVPGIVGLATALALATGNLEQKTKKVSALRDRLIDGILESIPYVRLNGHRTKRLPNNANLSFEFIEGESLLLSLDMRGIAASSGSACTSGSLDPSHVLLAIGLSHEIAHGSLRLTLSEFTTEEEVDYVIAELKPIVERLRNMSPLFARLEGGLKHV
ncbi:MAG: cysteine desulfurase NifS [Christensenellales bacterium]